MRLYSCVHTDRVHSSLLNFRWFPLVGSILVYPFPSGYLECIFSVVFRPPLLYFAWNDLHTPSYSTLASFTQTPIRTSYSEW